jgi:predicted ATPase/class 3 adenylate cyclase
VSARPTGTVSFLFTDIAGSTRLWETDRKGMAASLVDHDHILRETIEAAGGFVFATGGDSFSAAFPTASQALEAATTSQRALAGHSWDGPRITVRMGIHTGASEERDGNYFGPAVTRAARLMAIGHGGQVLLSATTAELLADRLEAPSTLVDLGTHTLKDMERPEHVFELRHPDLAVVTTPLVTDSLRDHLPQQLTAFVGRSNEVAHVTGLLDDFRVVTLTGVGGTGKTRLAIEAAREVADRFADGAWMAELAPVTDKSLVFQQIADVWGLRPGEGASLIQVVSTYLSTRETLLVIDNCEHVLDAVSEVVAQLLGVSPRLTILATSRESLGVPGETVFRVPSMTLPESDEEAADSDAVALFLDRFRIARPGYAPTDEDLEAIVRICRRLDGIPLGLELAAARLRTVSAAELANRLEDSFRLLTGGAKTALPRQRTLQATIDWSYDLLEPKEAELFRRVSTFVGGVDLEAVEDIGSGGTIEDWEIVDLIDQLVDKSLLLVEMTERGSRFRMLEPIRQYGQDRLVDEGEAEAVHASHAGYFAGLTARTAPDLRGSAQKSAHEKLVLDLDNLRAALTELRDHDRTAEFLTMCFDLCFFWSQASMQKEALDLLLPVLAGEPKADPRLVAKAWWVAANMAFGLTDPMSVEYAERGREAAKQAGDDMAFGWTSVMAAMAAYGTTSGERTADYFSTGKQLVEANLAHPWWDEQWDQLYLSLARSFVAAYPPEERMAALEQTVASARAAGDMFNAANAMTISYFLRESDDDPVALTLLEQSVQILSELGFRHGQGHALIYWGGLTKDRLGSDVGGSAVSDGAEILAGVGDIPCAVDATANLIEYLLESDRVEEALPHLDFAVRQGRTSPETYLERIAELACRGAVAKGDFVTAAIILGHRIAAGDGKSSSWIDDCREAVEAGLSAEEISTRTAEGARMGDLELFDLIGDWAEQG